MAVAEIATLPDEPPVPPDEEPPDPVLPVSPDEVPVVSPDVVVLDVELPQAVNNNVVVSILTKSTPIKLKRLINSFPGKKCPFSYTEGDLV